LVLDDAWVFAQEDIMKGDMAWSTTEAQCVALCGHHFVLEDGPEVADSESSGENHGQDLTGMDTQ
jgi:hypothetical protein